MKKLKDLVGRELLWKQPHALKKEYELRDGEELVAALRFRSMYGSFATAETADGNWTFKRVGFITIRVHVRQEGVETDLATFTNGTWSSGGTLDLPGGRALKASTNLWGSTYEFVDESGEALIRFRKIGGLLHFSSIMEIRPLAASMPELPWLAPLGWYLAVKLQDDAAAAAS